MSAGGSRTPSPRRNALTTSFAVSPSSNLRLLREGKYPPVHGTVFSFGDHHYLYTTGWLPADGMYPHGHVPSPLRITDHVGDTDQTALLSELLLMTKMNWNSINYAQAKPLTLRFAEEVGTILCEMQEGTLPDPRYRFYM